jgi:hypothetical protein
MLRKTAFAAAFATAIAAFPATAGAGEFYFGFQTPHGYFSFGDGAHPYPQPQPQAMSCGQAKNYLQSQFAQVWTVECNGQTYTFNVKNWGPVKTVKIDKWSGDYWYV